MTKSFHHKGLQRLFEPDEVGRLPFDMLTRIKVILSALHEAEETAGMNLTTFLLHPLKGDLKGFFPVTLRLRHHLGQGSEFTS